MNTRLKVKMFGWLRAEAGETVITHFRTRKTSALFGYLAFHSDRSHPREFLADMLWPEARGSASRNSLSQALTSLRQEIGRAGENVSQLLHADRSTVQLHGDTDVAQFEEAVKAGSNRDERIAALTLATVVYRGEFLPSHYDDWILAERSRLRDLFLTANHELVSLLRQVGQPHAAVSLAHRAVREDPLSERAIRDLMQAHVDSREPQLALRAYHDLEVNLEREVGERPSSETRELARRIAAVSSASENSVVVSTPPPPAGTVTCLLVRFACPPHTAPAWTAALAAVRARIKNEFVRFGGAVLSDERAGIIATRWTAPSSCARSCTALRGRTASPWMAAWRSAPSWTRSATTAPRAAPGTWSASRCARRAPAPSSSPRPPPRWCASISSPASPSSTAL
jgi:DNA-binding SARP family transcriptional activator